MMHYAGSAGIEISLAKRSGRDVSVEGKTTVKDSSTEAGEGGSSLVDA